MHYDELVSNLAFNTVNCPHTTTLSDMKCFISMIVCKPLSTHVHWTPKWACSCSTAIQTHELIYCNFLTILSVSEEDVYTAFFGNISWQIIMTLYSFLSFFVLLLVSQRMRGSWPSAIWRQHWQCHNCCWCYNCHRRKWQYGYRACLAAWNGRKSWGRVKVCRYRHIR